MQTILLFGPAVLMGVAILLAPHVRALLRIPVRQKVIIGVVACVVSLAILILANFDHEVSSFLNSVRIFWPIPLMVGVAGFLMQSSLQDASRISWWRIITSSVLLVSLCVFMAIISSGGGGLGAILLILPTVGVEIVAALWMVWSLPRWRKFAALIMGVAVPVGLVVSVLIGNTQSPETITEKNGNRIVQALEQYHLETGAYPTELTKLVPVYFAAVPEAHTTQGTGWLYTANDNQYTLGYWYYPEKYGVTLCLHSTENNKWECEPTYLSRGWGPFQGVPTPPHQQVP